jgi:hypothetical protein
MNATIRAAAVTAFSCLLSCASNGADTTTDGSSATVAEGLHIDVSQRAITRAAMPIDLAFPAGVAAAGDLVFVGSPFEGRVAAYSRVTKQLVGDLPAPPNGFVLPFILKAVGGHTVAVLDAGGFPSPAPFVPANPTIYEYSLQRSFGDFSAQLVRSIPFTEALIGFSEDIVKLDDGRYLINDAILGSIWIANPDGSVQPGLVPRTFEPADAIPQTYFCDTMPVVQVGGLPFLFTGSTIPGITAMAERDGIVYFSASCAGAVYSIPLASLSDEREPWQRAADIRLVSAKPAGVQVEELLGITFDPKRPHDPYLYAADALQLRVIRIDVRNGKRAVVADDPALLNFPSSLAFAPTVAPGAPSLLLAISNQQHRTVILNDAITQDVLQPPFLLTQMRLLP